MRANKYFKENLLELQKSKSKHPARAKWEDGTQAYKTSIYQVFEKYEKGELPMHTYRETAIKSAIQEILWIYKDQTSDLTKAHDRGISWWDSFEVKDNNTIGKAYGDTISRYNLLDGLLKNMQLKPFSQRHILSMWQEDDLQYQDIFKGLVPCAFMTQYTIIEQDDKRLINMHLQIRSSDYITAGAINRIQYYALGLMICGHLTHSTGIVHELNDFSVFTMDMHVYDRHEFAIEELLNNIPTEQGYKISLRGVKNFYDYDIEDFEVLRPKGLYKLSKKLELAV